MAWGAYVVVLGMLAILYFLAVFFFLPALIERRLENRQNDYAKRQLEKDVEEVDLKIKSGNAMADAILNSKMSLAGTKDIRLDVTAKIPEKLPVSDTEFSVIFGNLMDNAMEACAGIENPGQRFIRIYIDILKGQLYIYIMNSAKGRRKRSGRIYKSTKDGAFHGFGLMRIDKVVERYNGYLDRQDEDGVFVTEIMLPL